MFYYSIELDDPNDDDERPFRAIISLLETFGIERNILIANSMGVHPRQTEIIHKFSENFPMASFYQDPVKESNFCLLFPESISNFSDLACVLHSLYEVELCVYPLTDLGIKEHPKQILKKSESKLLREKLIYFSCVIDQDLCLHLIFYSKYYTFSEVSELLCKWESVINPNIHVLNQMPAIPHRAWVTWEFS